MARTPNRPQADSPLSDVLAQVNQNFDTIDDQDETKIIKNGSTPTLLLGRQLQGFGGQDYGLKIAKPGYDVTTATNDQLAFSSAFDYFKIVRTGTLDLTPNNVDNDLVEVFVNHNLGFPPAFLAFYNQPTDPDNPDRFRPLPDHVYFPESTGSHLMEFGWKLDPSVTSTEFRVIFTCGPAIDIPFAIRYYLLQETAN